MAWQPIERRGGRSLEGDICVSFLSTAGRLPVLRVTQGWEFAERAGWKRGEMVSLFIGTEDDSGKLRLARNTGSPIGHVSSGGNSRAMPIIFGHISELGQAQRQKIRCDARCIDADTIDIDLGDWPASSPAATVGKLATAPPAETDEDDGDDDREEAVKSRTAPEPKSAPSVSVGPISKGAVYVNTQPDLEAITFRAKTTELTGRQAALAAALAAAMPHPVARPFLCKKIWGEKVPGSWEVLLTSAIGELRRAAETIGLEVESVKGVGVLMREAA